MKNEKNWQSEVSPGKWKKEMKKELAVRGKPRLKMKGTGSQR